MSSRERRRKGRYQASERSKRRQPRPAPQPNVVVASQPVEPRVTEMPAVPGAALPHSAVPAATARSPIVAELKQVAILGGAILAVLVLLAILLGG